MSDLKWQTVEVLQIRQRICERRIGTLTGKLNNENELLRWIKHYITKKTPVAMSIADIEAKLGYKVNLIF
jgi:hypothetical protein